MPRRLSPCYVQPQGRAEIDWGNPITRSLRLALVGDVDAVTGKSITRIGTPQNVVMPYGQGLQTAAYKGFSIPLNLSDASSATIVYRFITYSVGTQVIFEFGPNTNTNAGSIATYFNRTVGSASVTAALSRAVGGVCFVTTPNNSTRTFEQHTVVCRYDLEKPSSQSCSVHLDGVLSTGVNTFSGGTGATNFMDSTLYCGRGGNTLGVIGVTGDLRVFGRWLSDSEATSISNNLHQVFR
jgi:hypothetical protein